jgi:hypothetical protein
MSSQIIWGFRSATSHIMLMHDPGALHIYPHVWATKGRIVQTTWQRKQLQGKIRQVLKLAVYYQGTMYEGIQLQHMLN